MTAAVHPILNPMPFLYAAFDFEAEDGGTHWCVRYKLPIGESGPDKDSEVLCEVFDGFAYDYPQVDQGNADPFDFTEAIAEKVALAFNAHEALVKVAENQLRVAHAIGDERLADDARAALKLARGES